MVFPRWLTLLQFIPKTCKYDANATPPQYTDHEGMTVENGTHVRVKIVGLRAEVGEMWAIGTINEDYLGYFSRLIRTDLEAMLTKMTDLCKIRWLRVEQWRVSSRCATAMVLWRRVLDDK